MSVTRLHSKQYPSVSVRFRSTYQKKSDYIIGTPETWNLADKGIRITIDHNTHTVNCRSIRDINLTPNDIKALMLEYSALEKQEYIAWYNHQKCLPGKPDISAFTDYTQFTYQ